MVIYSVLLKKSLKENFSFCATNYEISMSLDILMTKNFYKKFPKKIMRVTFKSVLRKMVRKNLLVPKRVSKKCRKTRNYCRKV